MSPFPRAAFILLSLMFAGACSSTALKDVSPSSAPETAKETSTSAQIELVDISQPEFQKRLDRATAKANFLNLANHFETQINKFYCGVASSVIVLNSLRLSNAKIAKPTDPTAFEAKATSYLPEKKFVPSFEKYTQHNFFNPKSDIVKSRLEVLGKPAKGSKEPDYGYTVRQLSETLQKDGLNVKLQIVSNDVDSKSIHDEIVQTLSLANIYVVVNYTRKALGQAGGGHISPVGAYDPTSDSFLVMDVNPNAASWVWVKSDDLIRAMRTLDEKENRGYLIIKEGI